MTHKNITELQKTLQNHNGNKLSLIYQWIREDIVSFNDFESLIKWIEDYQQEQIRLDSFD